MRVALFSCFYDEPNGVSTFTKAFEANAVRYNCPVQIITGEHFIRTVVNENVIVNKMFGEGLIPLRRMVERFVGAFRPDIIHVTGPSNIGRMGVQIAKALHIPVVATWHINYAEFISESTAADMRRKRFTPEVIEEVRRSVFDRIKKPVDEFYRQVTGVIAPTKHLADSLAGEYSVPVFTVGRGVDTNRFSPLHRTRTDDMFVIGYVGRLTADKGVEMLPYIEDSVARWFDNKYGFNIIGTGPLVEDLERNMNYAEFWGVLTGDELAREYANMDVLVFPSTKDSFGQVVLEALASGVPVVARSTSEIARVLPQSLWFADTSEEFGATIRAISKIPLEERRDKARWAVSNLSWASIFRELYGVYNFFL